MENQQGFSQSLQDSLIRRAQSGDVKAFERIYRVYADACFSLALRICGQHSMAQDVVHDVFVKVMQRIGDFQGKGAFASWIRRIVANEAISSLRRQNRLQLIDNEANDELGSHQLFTHNWSFTIHDLEFFLSKLNDNARAVLFLHEVEGYSHKEIGDMFGLSESFSKVTLSRAFEKLKIIADQQRGKENALKR